MNTRDRALSPVILDYFLQAALWMEERSDTEIATRGAKRLVAALGAATPKAYTPAWLPALDSIERLQDSDLGRSFPAIANRLRWVETNRMQDHGVQTALCMLHEMFDLGDLLAGVTYLDAGCTYPTHDHPPQEVYLTLSGTARWRYGGSAAFVEVPPGRVLYNHPYDRHSMIAGEEPLLALWALWED